nr:uncharacterized protein LOC115264271 [Aedes albopictus]
MASEQISYCQSQRGRPLLIFLGYRFRREMVKQYKTYWRCLVDKCPGRMITMLPGDTLLDWISFSVNEDILCWLLITSYIEKIEGITGAVFDVPSSSVAVD